MSAEQIDHFEQQYNVQLPRPMRDLYRRADGSSGWCIGELHVRPLCEVKPFDARRYPTLFELADYFVAIFGYAIQLDPARPDHGAIYAHWYSNREEPFCVASGLDGLLTAYLGGNLLSLLDTRYMPAARSF